MTEIRENRVKKLLYRSWYRGCKETDKIIGGWAKKNSEHLSDTQLDELEAILAEHDRDIYDWLTGKIEAPEEMQKNSVYKELLDFKPADEVRQFFPLKFRPKF